ncbi:MAG: DUF1285 domain-containing protein [Deltaproteobacteria bacterium]|nr:DUF1285 domain-containing protein [Deltaproteobacteria bacterium]
MSKNKEHELEIRLSENEMPPCGIFIDREGDWYYRGSPMERADIVSHLCQHLRREESSGQYIIQMGKQRCYLEVEDTPLVVSSVFLQEKTEEKRQEDLYLSIKHLTTNQPLNPTTLWVGKENVLYCKVMENTIPARFLRPAYYQLAEFIHEDKEEHRFYLFLSGKRYYIG